MPADADVLIERGNPYIKGQPEKRIRKPKASKAASQPTGLFWPCPAGQVPHPGEKFACMIKAGPRRFFARCVCDSTTFFPASWQAHLGLTRDEAKRQGFTVLG